MDRKCAEEQQNCAVIISDNEIASPVVEKPTSLIAMNQQSLDKFEVMVLANGTILGNSSLAIPKYCERISDIIPYQPVN
jgi:2-oxoglutarate ferredoxin oxidoreductase subunit gamma